MVLNEALKLRTLFTELKGEESLPIKIRYNMARFLYKTEGDFLFYQENFNKIIQEYSLKDETGDPLKTEDNTGIRIDPEKTNECMTKVKELESTDIGEWHFSFTEDEILKTNLSVDKLYTLMPYIIE